MSALLQETETTASTDAYSCGGEGNTLLFFKNSPQALFDLDQVTTTNSSDGLRPIVDILNQEAFGHSAVNTAYLELRNAVRRSRALKTTLDDLENKINQEMSLPIFDREYGRLNRLIDERAIALEELAQHEAVLAAE